MATERQIAANRRNAQKSKGPRSEAGKKRSSKNAYRHGLSLPMSVRSEARFRDLARQFAEASKDPEVVALAEEAAEAHLALERVKKVQMAMIERAPGLDGNIDGETWPNAARSRVLSDLRKTTFYEERAVGRRDRLMLQLALRKIEGEKSCS